MLIYLCVWGIEGNIKIMNYAGHQIAKVLASIHTDRPIIGAKYAYSINPLTNKPYILIVVKATDKRVSLKWDCSRKISVYKFSFLNKCILIA